MTNKKHKKRIILVSGGSRGLGLSLCELLLERGYLVVSFSRKATDRTRELEGSRDGDFIFFEADMSDPTSLQNLTRQVEKQVGPIYGLVNNAGIVNEAMFARQEESAIETIINVNLMGCIWLTRASLRGMLRRSEGRIINISSIVSVRGYKGVAAYSASKGGIDAMTRSLAREVGPRNITVNSIAPGYMKTDLTDHLSDNQLKSIARKTPLKRIGHVRDLSSVTAFFLSDEAGFITGQHLIVDGGLTC